MNGHGHNWLNEFGLGVTDPSLYLEGKLSFTVDKLAKKLGTDKVSIYVGGMALEERVGMTTREVWDVIEGTPGKEAMNGFDWLGMSTKKGREAYTNMAFPLARAIGGKEEPFGFVYIGPKKEGFYTERDVKLVRSALQFASNGIYSSIKSRDNLLGIPSRMELFERIESNLKENPRRNYSLLMIDLDFFKRINDGYGHLEGDRALKRVSDVINSILKKEYLFARYGGEEFAVFLPGVNLENATKFAEAIRKKVKEDEELKKYGLTASIGVYSSKATKAAIDLLKQDFNLIEDFKRTQRNGDIDNQSQLTRYSLVYYADGHLRLAKDNGRDKVCANIKWL